jgi:predicted ATPase
MVCFSRKYKLSKSFAPSQQPDIDIYAQYLKVLVRLTEKRTLIIFIDDIQWADVESINLLSYLAKRIPETKRAIMMVGAYRPFDLKENGGQTSYLQSTILTMTMNYVKHR